MAVTKKIDIDGTEVEFRASAAIPRLYRNEFGRDIYADLEKLGGDVESGTTLDTFSLEMFENLSWLMAKHANPDTVPDTPDEWLEQFNVFSIYTVLPAILDLWGMNTKTLATTKKNSVAQQEK